MKASLIVMLLLNYTVIVTEGLPVYWWQHKKFVNFGDYLSFKLIERIVGMPIREYKNDKKERKLLGIGSIISFARDNDVVWGSGVKRKSLEKIKYHFTTLDIRAVRGPLSRQFLMQNFNITVPEVYGDPALLIPYFFPEFKKKSDPKYEYLIIPHYSEEHLFPKNLFSNVAYPTDPWDEVIDKITDSKFVISSSLHGIIVAEAFGIPARLLRVITRKEPLFKYRDYYFGTGRMKYDIAFSIPEALEMGGEPPIQCDLEKLYNAFPFELWPSAVYSRPDFTQKGA
jgi:pyruvyltransferase